MLRVLAVACLLLGAGQAWAECFGRGVCIEATIEAGHTQLRGVNHSSFPITLQLDLALINMKATTPAKGLVVAPGESVALARLHEVDGGGPSSYSYRFRWARGDYRAHYDHRHVYRLPYPRGAGGIVTQGYGGAFSHQGDAYYAVDFAMPAGTPVLAARGGKVVSVREDSKVGGPSPRYRGAANYVVIQHADGTFGEYLHLQPNGVKVREGERVRRGQLIGLSGSTGFSGGPHLHFMVAGATSDGRRRSFPMRFRTSGGIVTELRTGHRYEPAESVADSHRS